MLFRSAKCQLEYEIYGNGKKKTFVAFHGFGRSYHDFSVFQSVLKSNERIVAINLFHHGKSKWLQETEDPFPLADWKILLDHLFEELSISRFSLLGYSLGGRIAMCTFELFPDRVEQILLFAPDGLKVNRFYDFITHARMGRAIYQFFDKRPEYFHRIVSGLEKSRLVSKQLANFALRHTRDEARRKLVMDVWQTFRPFFPNMQNMAKLLEEYKPPFDIFFGEYDIVIKPELGDRAKKAWGENVCCHTIPSGHSSVTPRSIELGLMQAGLKVKRA